MILNALCDYYDILALDENSGISKYGYEKVNATYVVVLSCDGELRDILNLSLDSGTKNMKIQFDMPKRTKISGISSSLVCDNFTYIFGITSKVEKGVSEYEKNKFLHPQKFETAKALHLSKLENATCSEAIAIKRFFEKWDINTAWKNECIAKHLDKNGKVPTQNIIFRLQGQEEYFHECSEIVNICLPQNEETEKNEVISQCSITGKYAGISEKHSKFQNINGAQLSGAYLISYKPDSFKSYNLEKSYNSCVSIEAEFKYSTALKYILSNMRQKMYIGDDTTVFWASSTSHTYVDIFKELFNSSDDKADQQEEGGMQSRDRSTEEMAKAVLSDGVQGIYNNTQIDPNTKFYVLGLAPNAGRISVRYFYSNSFKGFCEKIKLHHDDISIYGGQRGKKNITIGSLIYATISSKSRDKKPNPLLGGAVTRAILTGDMYPQILFNQTLIRVKAETDITQARAAIIKGYLLRKSRILNKEEEIDVYLNEQSTNAAYVLGRVFAILEKIQKDALGDKINATIKDKYFASACSNPSLVFPNLLKLTQHHLAKIEGKYLSIKLGECLGLIEGETFPKILNMENQGRFILGYYQQNQKNYEKKDNNKEEK